MAEDGDELPSVDHGRRTDEGRDKNICFGRYTEIILYYDKFG